MSKLSEPSRTGSHDKEQTPVNVKMSQQSTIDKFQMDREMR